LEPHFARFAGTDFAEYRPHAQHGIARDSGGVGENMSELANPRALVGIVSVAAVHAVALGMLLALFQRREAGFFERHGQLRGWAICLAVCLLFTVLGLLSVPFIVQAVVWFALALNVLGLTMRQVLKINVAQVVIYTLLAFAIVP
jgi:hypothetical protein